MRIVSVVATSFLLGLENSEVQTYLFHDSSLTLGECDMPARLVADELDFNLATLTAALLIIIVVVVAS
jgi:hypothetical protein